LRAAVTRPGEESREEHRKVAGLDIGAKDGKHRPLGHALEFPRILEVVEEEDRIEKVPRRREREREGVHERGEAVPIGGAPLVGGENLTAPRDAEGGQAVAHRRGSKAEGRASPRNRSNCREKLLQEMLGRARGAHRNLAEGKVDGTGGSPSPPAEVPNNLRQLESSDSFRCWAVRRS